jgi:hypothetical protein
MPNIWIEFRVSSPFDDRGEQSKKEIRIRSLIQTKVNDLQQAITGGAIESLKSAQLRQEHIFPHEKWIISSEGQADMVEFARGLRNEIAEVVSSDDMVRVTVEVV